MIVIEQKDMNAENQFMVVSSKCPSGATWLLNIFLELNIQIFRGEKDLFWSRINDCEFKINDDQKDTLIVHLPTLIEKSVFTFPEQMSVRWSHDWPGSGNLSLPLILYIRHGKDAVYSHYKRFGMGLQFPEYLKKPLFDDANPIMFQMRLPPAESWALYCILWKRLTEGHNLIIKFEDMRRDPHEELNKILNFLHIYRDTPSIENALVQSTFERTKSVEEKYRATHYQKEMVLNRRGKTEEYKEIYGEQENQFFWGLPDYVISELGYEIKENSHTGSGLSSEQKRMFSLLKKEIELAERDKISIKSSLSRTAAAFKGDLDAAISLGKVLACYEWTVGFFGDESEQPELVRKTMQIFFDIIPHFENRPLILVAAADAFANNGRKDIAQKILESILRGKEIHYFEKVEIGIVFIKLGENRKARNILLTALSQAPTKGDVEEVKKRLITLNEPHLLDPNPFLFYFKTLLGPKI